MNLWENERKSVFEDELKHKHQLHQKRLLKAEVSSHVNLGLNLTSHPLNVPHMMEYGSFLRIKVLNSSKLLSRILTRSGIHIYVRLSNNMFNIMNIILEIKSKLSTVYKDTNMRPHVLAATWWLTLVQSPRLHISRRTKTEATQRINIFLR